MPAGPVAGAVGTMVAAVRVAFVRCVVDRADRDPALLPPDHEADVLDVAAADLLDGAELDLAAASLGDVDPAVERRDPDPAARAHGLAQGEAAIITSDDGLAGQGKGGRRQQGESREGDAPHGPSSEVRGQRNWMPRPRGMLAPRTALFLATVSHGPR